MISRIAIAFSLLAVALAAPKYVPASLTSQFSERKFTSFGDNAFSLNLDWTNSSVRTDVIQFERDGIVMPQIVCSYGEGVFTLPLTSSNTLFRMGTAFTRLIEFIDRNGNGIYDAGEGVKSLVIKLGPGSWDSEEIEGTNATVFTYTASTITRRPLITIRSSFSTLPVVDPASWNVLTPNATKIDVEVENYPYRSNSTLLALETLVFSHSIYLSTTGDLVTGSLDGFSGYFSWDGTVSINSTNGEHSLALRRSGAVQVSPNSTQFPGVDFRKDDSVMQVYYTISDQSQPAFILWDPIVGFGADPSTRGNKLFDAAVSKKGSDMRVNFAGRSLINMVAPFGNMATLFSLSTNKTEQGWELDIIQFQISTVLPEVVMSYFNNVANFLPTAPITSESTLFRFGNAFVRLIEFTDTDGDSVYTPGTDTAVSNRSLVLQSWKPLAQDKLVVQDVGTVFVYNATTKDGMFSMQLSFSTAPMRDVNTGALLTPNSTKVDVEIRDFAYKGEGTLLALEALLFSTSVTASGKLNVQASSDEGLEGYFGWNSTVECGPKRELSDVHASSLFKANKKEFSGIVNFDDNDSVGRFYFTVGGATHPNYIFWDPAVGFGSNPAIEASGLAWWAWLLIAVACATVVVAGSLITWKVVSRRRHGNYDTL